MFSIELEGLPEFNAKLDKLIKALGPDKIEPILMSGAKIMTKAAKTGAPKRTSQGNAKKKPPGQLKKAIKTKKLKRIFNNPATAISAIDRKVAPHAHLVHEGTGERIGGAKSKVYRGKRFGKMPANPFFVQAWDENKAAILDHIINEASKQVKGGI